MDNLYVDFYDETHAAVRIQWAEGSAQAKDPSARRIADALLFACFTLRQFSNLGNHPSSRALAHELNAWTPSATTLAADRSTIQALPSHVLLAAAIDIGMDYEVAAKKYGEPVYLVPYRGQGKRRFIGRLGFTQERPVFLLKIKGFGIAGLLGLGAPLYAPDSVFMILARMTQEYGADPEYLEALSRVARDCANAFQTGKITSMNQENLALRSVSEHLPRSW